MCRYQSDNQIYVFVALHNQIKRNTFRFLHKWWLAISFIGRGNRSTRRNHRPVASHWERSNLTS